MTNQESNNQLPAPDSRLDSAVNAVLAQPLDQEAINRVKTRAKNLACTSVSSDESASNSLSGNRQSPKVESRRFKSRFWLNAIAASLVLALGAALLFSPNNSAFAKVIEKLQAVRTMSFAMEFVIDSDDAAVDDLMKSRVFVAEDGRCRIQMNGAVVIAAATGPARLMLHEETKEANIFLIEEGEEDEINYLKWFETLKSSRDKPIKRLGKKAIEGLDVEGFVVNESDSEITIWIEPRSNQIVQVELEESQGDVSVKGILKDFKFDEPLVESLFSLEVPAGYTVVPETPDGELPWPEEYFVGALEEITKKSDGTFPQNLDKAKVMFGIQALLVDLEEGDYEYTGAGKTRDGERSMVFWYRNQDGKRRAIYTDLTAAEIPESDNPAQPNVD